MDSALYLTQEELENIFVKLPEATQAAWRSKLVTETIDAFETEEELIERMSNVRTDDIPGMKEFLDAFTKTIEEGDLTKATLTAIPEVAMLRHFYAIGACGMSAIIGLMLQDPKLEEPDLQAAADFSVLRHAILQANASSIPA